jgi:hypothetical protein
MEISERETSFYVFAFWENSRQRTRRLLVFFLGFPGRRHTWKLLMTGENHILQVCGRLFPGAFSSRSSTCGRGKTPRSRWGQVMVVDLMCYLHRLANKTKKECESRAASGLHDSPEMRIGDLIGTLQAQIVSWWREHRGLSVMVLVLDQRVPQLKDAVRSARASSGTAAAAAEPDANDDTDATTAGSPCNRFDGVELTLDTPFSKLTDLLYTVHARRSLYEIVTQSLLGGIYQDSLGHVYSFVPKGHRLIIDGGVLGGERCDLPWIVSCSLDGKMEASVGAAELAQSASSYTEADTRLQFWCRYYPDYNVITTAGDIDVALAQLSEMRRRPDGSGKTRTGRLIYVCQQLCLTGEFEIDESTGKESAATTKRDLYIDIDYLYCSLTLLARCCWPEEVTNRMDVVDLLMLLVGLRGTDYTQGLKGRTFKIPKGTERQKMLSNYSSHLYVDHPELSQEQRVQALSEVPPKALQAECSVCPPPIDQYTLWRAFWSCPMTVVSSQLIPVRQPVHTDWLPEEGAAVGLRPAESPMRHHFVDFDLDTERLSAWLSRAMVAPKPVSVNKRAAVVKTKPERALTDDILHQRAAQQCYYIAYLSNGGLSKTPVPSGLETVVEPSAADPKTGGRLSVYGWQETDGAIRPALVKRTKLRNARTVGPVAYSYIDK